MSKRNCEPGLDDRCRDLGGEIRQKRGDTLVGTLRKTYGGNFAADRRADTKLENVLRDSGARSLTDYLKRRG